MEKTYGGDLRGEELKMFLHANADTIEEIGYFKAHEADEGVELRSILATEAISLNDLEMQKKEYDDEMNELMKPIKKKVQGLLSEIRQNGKHITEPCYKMVSIEESMVGYYNSDGHLVLSRPITSQEKQLNVFKHEEIPVRKLKVG
jgi:hypothetical protein